MLLGARRRSEGSSRLTTNVVASPSYSTSSDDRRRRASTSADQPLSDSRPLLSTEETTVEFTDALPTHRNNTPDVGSDIIRPQTTTTSQHGCQRKTGATSRSIPVIQLTTDDDTLPWFDDSIISRLPCFVCCDDDIVYIKRVFSLTWVYCSITPF